MEKRLNQVHLIYVLFAIFLQSTIKGCLETGNIQLSYCVDSNVKFYARYCNFAVRLSIEKERLLLDIQISPFLDY